MKKTIFHYARDILAEEKIEQEGFGNERDFWKVGNNLVEVVHRMEGYEFICRCTHCSIYSAFNPFCSTKAAFIAHLVLKETIKKKVK